MKLTLNVLKKSNSEKYFRTNQIWNRQIRCKNTKTSERLSETEKN